jgi:DNA-binding MarR family transcriptional regulator
LRSLADHPIFQDGYPQVAFELCHETAPPSASYHVSMADRLPLSALLSQSLVAFTIEFDNEFEHQAPHRTTNHGSTAGPASAPWLVSIAMWIKFMRFVPDDGIRVREFQRLAALTNEEMKTWLTRLSKWWGYVVVYRNAAEDPFNWLIRLTSGGQRALEVWRPLTAIIEKRWLARFGKHTVEQLRQSMRSLVDQFNAELPDYLPILRYDMLSVGPDPECRARNKDATVSVAEYALPMLLSKVLLAFAIRFERESRLSLAISANVLRLASEQATRVRDLPRLSGVSKEAIAMALKRLDEGGFAIVQGERKDSRVKALNLTARGQNARDTYSRLVWNIETRWEASFGRSIVNLRRSLECLTAESPSGRSALFGGLEPYPDGWRASVRRPEALPHYPMVLHRGGFPDGS